MNKLKQLLDFFKRGEKGEPVVFTTPNGIFLSPEAAQDFLDKKLKAQRDEIIEKIRKMEIEIKEDEDKFERSMREDMSLSGAIGYNKAIEEIIKILK